MKAIVLKWLLIIAGVFQIAYWGVSHLFFPRWYLQSVGLNELAQDPGSTTVFLNEIGVLAAGMGIASILAAFDPVRNFAVIVVLYIDGIGSMAVSLYHILAGTMASGEWVTVILIAVQIVLLTVLYPWSAVLRRAGGRKNP
jgi:hypothetical protein